MENNRPEKRPFKMTSEERSKALADHMERRYGVRPQSRTPEELEEYGKLLVLGAQEAARRRELRKQGIIIPEDEEIGD